jgi:cation diffusion facilitator CzcD-associated flavoprotein CzcO
MNAVIRKPESRAIPVKTQTPHVEVAIIGSGFGGLGMAIKLKQAGNDNFVVFERANDIGGTWRDNTYPGCACDVQSHLYSYSFAPNPNWSEVYSSQAEILAYMRQVTRQYGIMPHIRLNHNVLKATWQEDTSQWLIETSGGSYSSTFLVSAHGPLAEPKLPDIPGIASFQGTLFHSSRWNHDFDLTGKRVAVIGTGASAVQFVPAIQSKVKDMTIFQRTAPWIVPRMNRKYTSNELGRFRHLPITQQWSRFKMYWQREFSVLGFYNPRMEKLAAKLARGHLEAQVSDPELRQKLTPNYQMGCKRIMVSDDFYPALTKPNVKLITDKITKICPNGVVTADSTQHTVDTIIFGTGFYTSETPAAKMFVGRDNRTLDDVWKGSPEAYLGTTVHGFPNLFLLVGPNTGLGHSSIIFMIESQLAYIMDGLQKIKAQGYKGLEVRAEKQNDYNQHIQQELNRFVWTKGGCTSFYLDKNGKNTGLWPGFTFRFRNRTRRFDAEAYRLW